MVPIMKLKPKAQILIQTYLLLAAKNIQISMTKNVNIITYDTSTRNISFIAGFDRTANKTETIQMEKDDEK